MKQTSLLMLATSALVVSVTGSLSSSTASSSPREITLKNHCIERRATLENVDYLQGRIDRGEKLWQRTRKNLETARDGLRRHAEMLEEKIATQGADHQEICQVPESVIEPGNDLGQIDKQNA